MFEVRGVIYDYKYINIHSKFLLTRKKFKARYQAKKRLRLKKIQKDFPAEVVLQGNHYLWTRLTPC